ncbi:dihydroneopterin aldolase [Litorivivens sp.]|uniref:dihydroneopterin aldolase n=1 Tax=Litorivivens sp. TaxID=2020868 RepID=UPI0035698A99
MSAPTGDKILIRELRVRAIIGVHPWERRIPQLLLLDLDLSVDIKAAAATEDLSHTVDYAAVSERLTHYIQLEKFHLIETLAERCAALVLTEFAVQTVTFRVSKPEAVPSARTVSVEIVRQRDD